ncbi:low molecular weight protein-tyrosine-phosphatase [Oricola indica]|uniref:low molecular weight protein-tyrosine-phosphatase n=1 Tax=Oricola indica TaxID=2872591 RepID=UPI003CCB8A5F
MTHENRKSILFVCLGNICRSPLAEAVFRDIVETAGAARRFEIDSAGTGAWHVGNPPDPRSVEVGRRHGIDLSRLRARKVVGSDFDRFDLILGMDRSNVANLTAMAPASSRARIAEFHDFSTGTPRDVPDPYYGGDDGFEEVYRMIRAAAGSLFEKLGADMRGVSG